MLASRGRLVLGGVLDAHLAGEPLGAQHGQVHRARALEHLDARVVPAEEARLPVVVSDLDHARAELALAAEEHPVALVVGLLLGGNLLPEGFQQVHDLADRGLAAPRDRDRGGCVKI